MTDTSATPLTQPTAVVVPAPSKDQPTAWHWAIWLAIILPFAVMAILIWQLNKLEPSRWCGIATGAAKLTDTNALPAIQSCFGLLTALVDIYKTNTLALIVLVGIGNLGIIYTALRARLNVEAWGIRGGIGQQEDDRGDR